MPRRIVGISILALAGSLLGGAAVPAATTTTPAARPQGRAPIGGGPALPDMGSRPVQSPVPPKSTGVVVRNVGRDESFATAVTVAGNRTLAVGSSFVSRSPGGGIRTNGFALARFADHGLIDPSFSHNGTVVSKIGPGAGAGDVAIDPDGRIVVAGWVAGDPNEPSSFDRPDDFAVARYTPKGRLDRSFGRGDGFVTTDFGADDYAVSVALDGSGRIVVAGTSDRGYPDNRRPSSRIAVARYLPNGAPDQRFGSGGKRLFDFGSVNTAYDVAVDDRGAVELAGVHGIHPDSARTRDYIAVSRLNADGSPDRSFGGDGTVLRPVMPEHQPQAVRSFGDAVTALCIQPGGGVISAAYTEIYTRHRLKVRTRVNRLGPNGRFDRSFGNRGARMLPIKLLFPYTCATQPDGRIVFGGSAGVDRGRHNQFGLMRLRAGGRLDKTFGHEGAVKTDVGGGEQAILGLITLRSSKILAAGYGEGKRGGRFALARYRKHGRPDRGFG